MGPALSRDRAGPVLPDGNNGASKPKRFSNKEHKIMKRYLSSFVFKTKSTEMHRQIASCHWDQVFNAHNANKPGDSRQQTTGRVTELYDVFYALLENQSPELKHVFRSSMQVRGKVLVHISIGMRTLLSSDKLLERISILTQTHRRFGVKVEYYNAVGEALIQAIKVTSGELWTSDIENAWQRLFSHSSVILIADQLQSERTKRVEKSRSFLGKAGPSVAMFKGEVRRKSRIFSSNLYSSIHRNSMRDGTQSTTISTD